jgi:cell division protein FtsI (penicillin-binding protein 3)
MPKRPIKKSKNKNPMQTVFTRYMLIIAIFILWIGAIGVRLVHLQVNQSEWLRGKAQNQRRDIKKSKQLRGTIFDRSEHALAMSVNVKSLYADPAEIEDLEVTAKEVAKVLKLKSKDVLNNLKTAKENNKRFVWLARKLDAETFEKVNKQLKTEDLKKHDLPKFAGLHWREEQQRSYPYKTLAAHVIGFANSEDTGSAGIEQSQEEFLHGAIVKQWQDRDRLGRVYEEEIIEREPPKDVVLTISSSIQYKAEQALAEGVKRSGAKSGMAIVLDPKTGEILALANYPTFDPNRYTEFPVENYKNKAVQDMYSPGSIYKLISFGGALQENMIRADAEIDCSRGFIEVGGRKFVDAHAKGTITYSHALAVSSNYAAIKTAVGLGKDRFYGYSQKFGFGQPTGIELPAESSGVLRSPSKWNGDSIGSMAIGYEMNVTLLQAASAYAAVANNGVRVKPHIIREIREPEGEVITKPEVEKTQVVRPEVAKELRTMLQEVVQKGTAKRAQLNGYSSAGKTGTAWKYDPKIRKYNPAKYVSSFVGFAPAENPSVVIAVVMDEPRGGARDGGQVSAPVFREIAEQILPELNVIPDANIKQEILTAESEIPTETEIAPDGVLVNEQTEANNKTEKIAKAEKSEKEKSDDKPKKETKKEEKTPADKNKPAVNPNGDKRKGDKRKEKT